MSPLFALLAAISFWTSSEQLKSWLSLDPSLLFSSDKENAALVADVSNPNKNQSLLLFLDKCPEKEKPSIDGPPDVKPGLPPEDHCEEKPTSLLYVGPPDHPFAIIDWNGAPQIAKWRKLAKEPGEEVFVQSPDGDPLLLVSSKKVRLAFSLEADNRQFLVWPVLPYVMVSAARMSLGDAPSRFAQWPTAPLPTLDARTPIYSILVALMLLSLTLFLFARRASRGVQYSQETLDAIAGNKAPPGEPWAKVSFRRPLAGFLFYLMLQIIMLISLGYVTEILAANTIQPFPWVDGTSAWVATTFEVVWYLFDCGTRDAFIRFFAEKRNSDPQGALRCAQFFVWWQFLTGMLQITLITFLALEAFPDSSYALYAWPLLLQAAGQWPGVQNIFSAYFQGAQRFDYAQILDSVIGLVIGLIFPIGFVLAFRAWGASNPAYGEAMGALIGLAVSSYVSQLTSMFFGMWLARRARLPVRALFYVSFDKKTAKEMLKYGALMTLGQMPNRLSFAINNFILKAKIPNYSELSGIYGKANGTFVKYFKWPYSFYASGVPGLAEAFGAKKLQLARYYIARFAQYGALFTAIIFALVVGTGEAFVKYALDPQWARVSDYLFLISIIGLLLGPSWISDTLQQGAGRPGVFGLMVSGEQLARVGLFLVLVERYSFDGFLFAIFLPLLVKTILAWWYNSKKILRPTLSWWVHCLAPLLIGAVLLILFQVASMFVSGAFGASVLLFGGGLFAILFGFFLGGLFGIFDKIALDEMQDAAQMTGRALAFFVNALPASARLGYRISPVQERYTLSIAQDAIREANELTSTSTGQS
jgi:O-antigen/teichoic acid export membrane protein